METKNLRLALMTALSTTIALSASTLTLANDLVADGQPQIVDEYAAESDGMYLVRLAAPPVASYEGGIAGLKATSAKAKGQRRLDSNSNDSKRYAKFLRDQQEEVLDEASQEFGRDVESTFDYQYAVNGFAVELTADEARAMRKMDGVVAVERERTHKMQTDAGPAWIGAPEMWVNPPDSTQGEGVVIAILDSGINYDHPSFAAVGGDGYVHTNPLGSGVFIPNSYCDVVDPNFCNDKLIGAWSFVAEAVTPNDSDGHGSHTASTAAGNVVFGAEQDAPTTTAVFDISGVAPHANIIAYDVCIDSCPGAALVAGVEQAIIDAGILPNGIAALNYSISGGNNPYNETVELGFLNAVEAGIYVATSGGNSGPAAGTVGHQSPWVSATAAMTHDRSIDNSLIDLNSAGGGLPDIRGAGLTGSYGPAQIINSADLEGTYPGSTLCGLGDQGDFIPPWPANTFNGEIVACTRGTYGRVEKGANVLAAGAGGYILMDDGGGLVADPHVLPGVHITQADGAALAAWLAANPDGQGTISGYEVNYSVANGDIMAGFSSRGPGSAGLDVIKPDLAAPGVSVFAAVADGAETPPEYGFLSGTSMASPHNAGAAALMSALHPDWSPQEIKSALMLTANNENTVKEDGVTPTDPFDVGAGRIDLGAAKEAGLLMSETIQNYLDANPETGGDPSTLNLASMQKNNCYGTCSWTRTVTNPEKSTSHWNVTASAENFDLSVEASPEANSDDYNLKIKKGADGTLDVTADTTFTPEGWHFGTVDLDRNLDKGPDLSMPVAVYASKATDATVFTKTVDKADAGPGETLTYEIFATGDAGVSPLTITDVIPEGTTFVPASETESVVNGSTTTPWAYDGGSNSLTWVGELNAGDPTVSASPAPFGYVPLSAFFAPTPPPSNPDEGCYGINLSRTFTYNGQSYNRVIWSMNGTIEVGGTSGFCSSFFNLDTPDPAIPNNLLAPFWSDFDFSSAGNIYFGYLSAGGGAFRWLIFEWQNAPFWDGSGAATFQIWIGTDDSLARDSIHYTYARIDTLGSFGFMTVGAENASGTGGDSWYFDGVGTPPVVGTDLAVSSPTGTATLGFQVTTDGCANIVNEADVTDGVDTESAFATTTCE